MHSSFVLVVHRELKQEECETVAAAHNFTAIIDSG